MRNETIGIVAPVGVVWLFVATILAFLTFGVPHCEAKITEACVKACGPGNVAVSGGGNPCRCIQVGVGVEPARASGEGGK